MSPEIIGASTGETPDTHHLRPMVIALLISFTVIGMLATHEEQTALNRIEDRLG